jgi:AAA domain
LLLKPDVRLDYYRQVLLALKAHVVVQELLVNITTAPTPTRVSRHVTEWLDLREAVEQALERLHVQAVVIDEAQHLMQVAAPLKPADQLDWLKSMTNRTNVLHVLVGTYDLFDFRNLHGQAARRGRDIHFPRYHVDTATERQEFVGALRYLLEHVPLPCDVSALLAHWRWFADGSVGCVGILKDWLVQTVAATLGEAGATLTLEALTRHALQPAQRVRLEVEARAIECPTCGAVRTVHLQGDVVRFPTHQPLRTRTTKDVTRWVRQGTVWTLWEKSE